MAATLDDDGDDVSGPDAETPGRPHGRWGRVVAIALGVATLGGAAAGGYFWSRHAARVRAEAELAAACDRSERAACGVLCDRAPPVPSACVRLGAALTDGPAARRDEPRALRAFERACGGGDFDGCARLGRALYNGSGTRRDPTRARGHFQAACDGGSSLGCAGLGHLMMFGHGGAPRDAKGAVALFQRSCDAGEPRGCASLAVATLNGTGVEQDRDRAFSLFSDVCAKKVGRGCLGKALMLFNGLGAERDEATAVALLREACDGDTQDACAELGQAHLLGRGVPQDLPRAVQLLERACTEAPPSGCAVLAELVLTGQAGTPDPKRALALLERACEHEQPEGCSALGMVLLTGAAGIPADPTRGERLVRKACEDQASPVACGQLATLEAQGVEPVRQDLPSALRRARGACDQGYPPACTLSGMLLLEPSRSAADAAEAAKLLELGCRSGDGNGCALLGAQLIEGRGQDRDPKRGLELLRDACEKLSSVQGCAMLARARVLAGLGSPEERKQAAELAGALCLQGEASSCIVAAAAHIEGRGVPRDLDRGARYLVFACTGGFDPACQLKQRLPAGLVKKLETELASNQAALAASAAAAASAPPPRPPPTSLSLLPGAGP